MCAKNETRYNKENGIKIIIIYTRGIICGILIITIKVNVSVSSILEK